MILSGSTLLAITLLIAAASLASYLVSQWPLFRSTERTSSWIALSLGTSLLIAAAVAAVLFASVPPINWLIEKLGLPQSLSDRWQSERLSNLPPEQILPGVSQTLAHDVTAAFKSRAGAMPGNGVDGNSAGYSGDAVASYATPASQSTYHREPAENSAILQAPGLVGMAKGAWDATRCIVSYHPDPLDPTRWFLENDCGAPVAVLVATCEQQLSECDEHSSGLWNYREGGMILPAKYQRSITYAEQTQYGASIRYVGCVVEQPWAVNLIGRGLAAFSSAAREATQPSDSCLARVRHLAEAGSTSGTSMDLLVGEARPRESN